MADPQRRAALEAVDLKQWFAAMPWKPGRSPVSAAPEYEDYLFEQWTHGTFDDYWAQPGIYAAGSYAQFADVPQIHMSSWYDPYCRTATENYLGLAETKKGPVRLILGPWTHGDRSYTYSGDVDFGPNATLDGNLAPDFLTFRLRWFDRWLRGLSKNVDAEPAVSIFVMGGGSGQRNADGRLDHGGETLCFDEADGVGRLVYELAFRGAGERRWKRIESEIDPMPPFIKPPGPAAVDPSRTRPRASI